MILFYCECVFLCDSLGNARTRKFHVIVPHVLHLDLDVQLSVLVPNFVVVAAKDYTGREKAFDTKRRLLVIGKLKHGRTLWIAVWSTMLFIWRRMSTPWVHMLSHSCVCHANITLSNFLNWTSCCSRRAGTSPKKFPRGFWGQSCLCVLWLSWGMNWKAIMVRWRSIACSLDHLTHIGHARLIGCRWK